MAMSQNDPDLWRVNETTGFYLKKNGVPRELRFNRLNLISNKLVFH